LKNIGDTWATGNGIFETIRVEDHQVFALHRHHCRAKETAEKIGLTIPSEEFVSDESYKIINSEDFKLGRLRWHFSADSEFTISYTAFEDPITPSKLMVFDDRKSEFNIQKKEFPYKNLERLQLAKSKGFSDGIIVRSDGQVAESSMATLLFKIDNDWITPPLTSGILNGVVRALVLEAGLAQVKRVEESELAKVQSGLLLTSLRNAQSIGSINGRELVVDEQKCAEIHKLMKEFKGR
jgi:branched-subunit amino acid aminotransferase/4-amino-4-deoxychorismate lyase